MTTLDRVSLTAVGVGALFVFAGCAAPATDEAAGQTQSAITAAEDEAFAEALPRSDVPLALASTDVDDDTDVEDEATDEAKDEAKDEGEDDENVDSTSQGIFIGGFGYPGFGFGGVYPGFGLGFGRFGGFFPGVGFGYGFGYPFGFGLGRAWGFRSGFIW
jgi:hypothetical protein